MISKERISEIAEEYYDEIYSFCYSNSGCNEHDARDITQDIFLLLQEKAENLEDINIRVWLRRTAALKMKEYYRKNKKEQSYLRLDSDVVPFDIIFRVFDEYFPITDDDIKEYIKIIIKSLNDTETILFKKLYIEKKSYAQIAEEMGLTPSAVGSKAFRLRKKIKLEAKLVVSVVGQIIIKIFF